MLRCDFSKVAKHISFAYKVCFIVSEHLWTAAFGGVFRKLPGIYGQVFSVFFSLRADPYLGLCQTSMMELFSENS